MNPVLRSQEDCLDAVRALIYVMPATRRKFWRQIWAHLYSQEDVT